MSEKNRLIIKENSNRAVILHDNGLRAGSIIEQAVSRLDEHQVQNLLGKAAEEALRLEIKNREQNMNYILGVNATKNHCDTVTILQGSNNGLTDRTKVISDINTGAGKMTIESKSGATCFVASVAYDDPNHPDVMLLRWYRDNVLVKSYLGTRFIALYWNIGPKIAVLVEKSTTLKKLFRYIISKIVIIIEKTDRK
jgi:hypothetical protein